MTLQRWEKKYHDSYRECLKTHDPHIVQYITGKESFVIAHPTSYSYLGYSLQQIRKFTTGKLRILYALSTEYPDLWESSPEEKEIFFLYAGFRDERTYKEVEKHLRKHNII